MNLKTQLSQTENEIMEFLWENNTPTSFSDILIVFNNQNKNWKQQTLSTLLLRLVNKGLLKKQKQGRIVLYEPSITKKNYECQKTKQFIDLFYDGSLKNLMLSLYNGNGLEKSDIEDLKEWLDEM